MEAKEVRKLMYWTAKMTSAVKDGGGSDEDVVQQIEKKFAEIQPQCSGTILDKVKVGFHTEGNKIIINLEA